MVVPLRGVKSLASQGSGHPKLDGTCATRRCSRSVTAATIQPSAKPSLDLEYASPERTASEDVGISLHAGITLIQEVRSMLTDASPDATTRPAVGFDDNTTADPLLDLSPERIPSAVTGPVRVLQEMD